LTPFGWKSQHPLDQSALLNLATQAAIVRYNCGTAPNWSATMISIPRLILCTQRTIACMHHFHPGYASQLLLLSTWTLRQNQTRFQHYPQQFAPVTVRSSTFATLMRHDACRLACLMASSPRRITMTLEPNPRRSLCLVARSGLPPSCRGHHGCRTSAWVGRDGFSLNSRREGKQHASRAQKSPRCTAESSAMAVVGAE